MPALLSLEQFAPSRGFTVSELEPYVRVEDGHLVLPTMGRQGPWYERLRCDMGCHPKYSSPKGSHPHLYNPLGLGPHSDELWIAEGELDTLSLVVCGIPALGVLGAQTFNRAWRHLFESATITIALDPDQAGRDAAEKLASLFEEGQTYRFDPSPYGDLNEWFAADRQEFEEVVKGW